MNSRRTVILIIAVVVGALAAVGLLNYVQNAESGAGEAGAPVEIWVVQQPIPKGTPAETAIEQQLIGRSEIPQRYRPATSVTEPSTELAGLVAISDLPVNMPIVTGNFVSPKIVDTGITDRLEERGLVTVSFTVDQARGAAFLIEPGDFVNVLIERQWETPFFDDDPPIPVTPEATAELAAELQANDAIRPILTDLFPVDSRLVYQKAEVLAIGTNLVPDIGQTTTAEGEEAAAAAAPPPDRGLITLAVPPEAAQVILNVGRDNIYLSLVPDDYEPRPILPLDPTTQVLPGESDGRLTPYEGFEGVIDPTDIDDLTFSEGEDRIGTTPGAGASETPATTAPPDTTAPPPDEAEPPAEGEEGEAGEPAEATTTVPPEGSEDE